MKILLKYIIIASIVNDWGFKSFFVRSLTSHRPISINRVTKLKMSTKDFPDFILGSGSSTRKLILKEAGYSFDIVKSDIDEKSIGDRTDISKIDKLVVDIATAKANDILSRLVYDKGILLTADQVVLHKNKVLEKPSSLIEAKEYIDSYRNSYCQTVGSIVLTDVKSGKKVYGVDTAKIYFSDIPANVIDVLLKEGDLMYCAGGLMIEHPLVRQYTSKIEGSEDSLMGLSISLLKNLLNELKEIK